MNKQSLGALIALNAALLIALALVGLSPQPAQGQSLLRPQYMMISGQVPGRIEAEVYIVELNTARVAAIIFRSSDNTFEVQAPPQSMAQDFISPPPG